MTQPGPMLTRSPSTTSPFEHDIDVDEDVAAGAYAASDVDSRGVGDARTFVHEGFGETPLVEPLQCRELHAIVDAEHLLEGLRRDGADRHSFLDRKGDDIGEVVLALRVVAAHTLEPTPHVSGTSCEDPRVDLRDVALLVACIPFFDDAAHVTVRTPDDSAVSAGVVDHRGDERDAATRGQRRGLVQRGAIDQRHVAVEHQHRRIVGNAGHRQRHGVTGAELLALLHPLDVGCRHGFTYGAAAVSVDDVHGGGAEPARGLDDMGKQRTTSEEMEDFRQVRAHALSLPCRENDHMQRRHFDGCSGLLLIPSAKQRHRRAAPAQRRLRSRRMAWS